MIYMRTASVRLSAKGQGGCWGQRKDEQACKQLEMMSTWADGLDADRQKQQTIRRSAGSSVSWQKEPIGVDRMWDGGVIPQQKVPQTWWGKTSPARRAVPAQGVLIKTQQCFKHVFGGSHTTSFPLVEGVRWEQPSVPAFSKYLCKYSLVQITRK